MIEPEVGGDAGGNAESNVGYYVVVRTEKASIAGAEGRSLSLAKRSEAKAGGGI